MKKALLVLLMVLLLTGAPALMGGAHGAAGMPDRASAMTLDCPDCGPAVLACTALCGAFLALGTAAALTALGAAPRTDPPRRTRLVTSGLFRPPRLV